MKGRSAGAAEVGDDREDPTVIVGGRGNSRFEKILAM
jgi:hypothetical protein